VSLLAAIGWVALALILWTHIGYPILAFVWSKLLPRQIHAADIEPFVALVIAAHNEADVIEAKIENALALDYPSERLRIIVTSDASDDGTDELVERYASQGIELVRAERGGKVNAQDTAVRALGDWPDLIAFSATRCAGSCVPSPTSASRTSAAGCPCARPTAPTARAPTGASRLRCAAGRRRCTR
jgi:cellulose synthase/poly-beta-1,6-N-acetylglucosamine synthase-like glycosyltransferase